MGKYLLLFIAFFLSNATFAQINKDLGSSQTNRYARMPKQETLGTTELTCVYNHYVFDPVLNEKNLYRQILQAGKDISLFCDYGDFVIDSIVNSINRNKFPKAEYNALYQKYKAYNKKRMIIKNKVEGELSERGNIFIDHYVYRENIPSFDWSLHQDTMTICGHECKKATATFRGRTWIVWYAENINISDGPWKFNGLPGLILKAESEDKEIRFVATQILFRSINILKDKNNNDFYTTRERFLKMEHSYKTSASQYIAGIVDVTNGDLPNTRMFYNPIEKDIKITQ